MSYKIFFLIYFVYITVLNYLFLKKLAEPMALKYGCPSQSTWQLAVTTFNKVN